MRILILFLFITLFICGCSGGGSNILSPDETPKSGVEQSSHSLWGIWQFVADPAKESLDVVQLRSGDMHLNALHFLEPPQLVYLTVESVKFNGNIIDADIGLKHPFSGHTEFTGFDVCGILITNGSVTGFTDPDLHMAGEGDTRLLNPDGYSRWWNPAEFPHGNNIYNYKDGLLGTPDSIADYNSTLNAYKYFCDDLGANDPLANVTLEKRGMFSAGKKNIRHYTIEVGNDVLVFNYAVDACWHYPNGGEPWVAPDDFPPGANRPEAWRIEVTEVDNTLWNDGIGSGGDLLLSIDVYDWYNAELNSVKVESPGNFAPVTSGAPIGGGTGFSTYEIAILSAAPAEGSINLLISVESDAVGYGGLLPGKPVTAYFIHASTVAGEAPHAPGWARTWGGNTWDEGFNVATDSSGNVYVTGYYRGTEAVDFDPGPSEDWHTPNGVDDAFLSKFDSSGNFLWAKTWGGIGFDYGYDVTVDGLGNVYVTGCFQETVDFDPGSGEDIHSAHYDFDAYLSKFDSTGDFIWAKTWGGTSWSTSQSVDLDVSGDIYVAGHFMETTDFDPGSGVDDHTSNGSIDAFLSKFDSSGAFIWAKTWGGSGIEYSYDAIVDGSNNIYMTGCFQDTVDFDPGTGEDWHGSNGNPDAYLSKFDSSGDFIQAETWGGAGTEYGYGLAADSSDDVYVTGYFEETADFDPGLGEDWHTSNGYDDVYLSKFDSSGNFLWAKTWGGIEFDFGKGVVAGSSGNVYVTGAFSGSSAADFDPGPGEDWHTPNGSYDIYLSRFDSAGAFVWARTLGGSLMDLGSTVTVDGSGNIYMTGFFSATVDFDPGPGEDWHVSNGEYDVFLSKFLPDGGW